MSSEVQTKDLKPIPIREGDPIQILGPEPIDPVKILIIDTETTGVNHKTDEVLEVAATKLVLCRQTHLVYSIEPSFSCFREPSKPIPDQIVTLTGITDDMVLGQSLDLNVIYKNLEWADLIVAHNASFDRPFCEKVLPILREMKTRWACSCWDPDWKRLGFGKRRLGYLLDVLGYTFPAHRAINDTIAVAWALFCKPEAVYNILKRGYSSSYRLKYTKTPYKSNGGMKERGFRFSNKSWVKSYDDLDQLLEERAGVESYFSTFGSGQRFECNIMEVDPFSRFSANI